MKYLLFFCFTFLFFSLSNVSFATHIAGGEISYQFLNNDTYLIKLTLYRDCFNGVPPFDNPATIAIFDSSNQLVSANHVSLLTSSAMNNSPFNCIQGLAVNVCYEKGVYEFKSYLPRRAGGYQIAYQRCCRPAGIVNITNVTLTGMTCYAIIPDSINAVNSSPAFVNDPFTVECQSTLFTYDHSATESDGDSIAYSLCAPFDGANNVNPMPDPPYNPPYSNIAWATGYSLSDIFGGGTPMTIDSITGMLSGMAANAGIYVYGVCAKEFRNGINIGETKRDFQVNVVLNSGVDEIGEEQAVQIFPNPVNQKAVIRIKDNIRSDNVEMVFYNSLGCVVKSMRISNDELIFDKGELLSGIYFYRIICEAGMIGSGNLVIE